MYINLRNKRCAVKFTEDEINNFLKNYNLLDITKYFYNSSSIITSTDYRTLKDIYTSYYSRYSHNGTYNDDFLDYINANSSKDSDFDSIKSLDFSLSEQMVTSYFNNLSKVKHRHNVCVIPNIVVVDNLYWSDESDEEDDIISQSMNEDFDSSMLKIGYNAIIQCIREKQSIMELKRLVIQQDLVSRLESRIRVNIYNNSGLIYDVFFIDSNGLIRLLNNYIYSIHQKLIKAYITIVDSIIIDDVFDIDNNYIVCFLDTISIDTSESHKLIVIIDTTLGYGGIDKNYSNIYHIIINEECNISYFTHNELSEFDILSIVTPYESICIPFNRNDNTKIWIQKWLDVQMDSEPNLNPELMIIVDIVVKSISTTMGKYIICFLPVSLSDIKFDHNYNCNLSNVINKSKTDLMNSKCNEIGVKYIIKSILYDTGKYYNLNDNNIQTHIQIDDELFNLLDQEINKQSLNNILGY